MREQNQHFPNQEFFNHFQRKRHQQRHALNILFLVLLLAMFLLSFSQVIGYEADITRTSSVVGGELAVPILEMRPKTQQTPLVAIVAHGYAGSKNLMTSFGTELAHSGITVVLMDFPGHGQSQVLSAGTNLLALDQVVQSIRLRQDFGQPPQIILIGHSMGSAIVGNYAVQHSAEADIDSTIMISPSGQLSLNDLSPKNLLILTGENDLSLSIEKSYQLLRQGCLIENNKPLPDNNLCGNSDIGTARHLVIMDNLDHLTILNANSTFQEILDWLQQNKLPFQAVSPTADLRLMAMIIGVICALLAVFPFASLLTDIFTVKAAARKTSTTDILLFTLFTCIGIGIAIIIQHFWRPFSFIPIAFTNYLVGYFVCIALVTGSGFLLFRRYLPIPPLSQVFPQVVTALFLLALLYFTLGQLSTFSWQYIALTPIRFPVFVLISLCLLPFFFLEEGIIRGYQEQGLLRAISASLLSKGLLLIGLLVAANVTPGLGFLNIVIAIFALLFVFVTGIGTQLYLSGKASIAGATFSALLVAWCISTSFPLTQY